MHVGHGRQVFGRPLVPVDVVVEVPRDPEREEVDPGSGDDLVGAQVDREDRVDEGERCARGRADGDASEPGARLVGSPGAEEGAWGADKTGSWFGGVAIGAASGAALAFVYAIFAIHLRADQIVGGTGINFLALGITGYLYNDIYGNKGTPENLPAVPDVHLTFLSDIPPQRLGNFLFDSFGSLNLMIWISLILLPVSYVALFKTARGLRVRSVGEHPRAADTVGISVYATRYSAVTLSGLLAALGGVFLSIGYVNAFSENMTAGRGFIALAALIFGGWRPFGAFAACLLFGFSSALAQRLPDLSASESAAWPVLFQALPYVLTLIAVAGIIGRSIPPAADGQPYEKQ